MSERKGEETNCTIVILDPPRGLKPDEKRLLAHLLETDFAASGTLALGLPSATVIETHDHCPTFKFRVQSEQTAALPEPGMLLEGEGKDSDGMSYKILLFSHGEGVFEVEFFRGDLAPFAGVLDLHSLNVHVRAGLA
jgi:hypothetical protein